MARYKLTLEYSGARYSGWQIQRNARTVQGELHRTLKDIAKGGHLQTYGAGRTDAGVHALGQVAHVDLAADLPAGTLVQRINDGLPYDINVLGGERVPARFHARHSAVARSYLYQIALRRSAFAKPFVWWVREALDLDAMRAAAGPLLGLTDFRAFTDDDPEEKSTRVLLDRVEIQRHGSLVLVRVVGSHFLWRMVRRLVGVLAGVGRRELSAADMPRLLAARSDLPARLTAPASGLFLEQVFYEEPVPVLPLVPALFRAGDESRGFGLSPNPVTNVQFPSQF
jgi:tRNA pseudouridine38-40 synthase